MSKEYFERNYYPPYVLQNGDILMKRKYDLSVLPPGYKAVPDVGGFWFVDDDGIQITHYEFDNRSVRQMIWAYYLDKEDHKPKSENPNLDEYD